jgi:hypothetical protein
MNIKFSADLDQWHLARWSKFTASENYKLLTGNGSNVFGAGAMTYIKEKVLQMTTHMWERPELDEVKSLLHGKMYEYPAYKATVQATGYAGLIYLGEERPLFLEYEPLAGESGGSPDSISLKSDSTVDIIAEIKCPKNPMYHFDRLKWKTQWDIKEGYNSTYCQIQNLLMITGAELGLFVSYDDRQIDVRKKAKIIEVKPDKKFQDNLDLRLRMAVKEKYKVFEEYNNF